MVFYCEKCKNHGKADICSKCQHIIADEDPTMFSPNAEEDDKDPVNHPAHYATGKFECIEVMREIYGIEETQDFCLLNAFKYLWRCKRKKNKVEDIDKARYYLNEFLKLEDEKHGKS